MQKALIATFRNYFCLVILIVQTFSCSYLFLAVALTTIFSCWSTPVFSDMVLVDAKTLPCLIITIREGSTLEEHSAIWLSNYLKTICGQAFSVRPPTEPLPARAIVVGKRAVAAAGVTIPDDLGNDGFIIKTEGDRLYIAGGGHMGTAFGIFAFLQNQLNCQWWSWNEEDVPKQEAIKLGNLDIKEKPAFVLHDIMSREAQTRQNHFVYKSRALSTLQFTGNHTMYKLLTPAAKENPEFWPMNDKGERAPNNLHFNYLAKGIDQALADALSAEVDKRKVNIENFIYFAGQGDWYGGLDQSPESKKSLAEDGPSGALIQMMNRTGKILDKKYPGIQVGTFAYMSTDTPPYQTIPGDNVNIWLPRLRYGITLSIEEASSEKNPNEESYNRSQKIKNSIEKWAKIAPARLFIWEYGVNYNNFVKVQPALRAIAKNIKYYHRIGVEGIMIQGNYVSMGGDLVVLKNWIWSRLLWNPDLEVDNLLKEFCDGYYGPASAEMIEYVNIVEESVREPKYIQLDEFSKSNVFLTPEVEAKMRDVLKRALKKTDGEANAKYARRVLEAGASLDAGQLWSEGELVEKDGYLIRSDIKGGENAFERARYLPEYLRGSSKTEWGTSISQQRNIIPLNGGPLYTLEHGGVTAKIAPYQGYRRLWAVQYNGKHVMSGSINAGAKFFEPFGEPTDSKIEIIGETGYANWDPQPYHLQKEIITQDKDGTLYWEGAFEQIIKGNNRSVTPVAETAYWSASLHEAQERAIVEIKTDDGWEKLKATEWRGTTQPKLKTIEPTGDFQLRVTTSKHESMVVDDYSGQNVTAYMVTFEPRYKALKTYVQFAPVVTEFGKTVPSFQRKITVKAGPK